MSKTLEVVCFVLRSLYFLFLCEHWLALSVHFCERGRVRLSQCIGRINLSERSSWTLGGTRVPSWVNWPLWPVGNPVLDRWLENYAAEYILLPRSSDVNHLLVWTLNIGHVVTGQGWADSLSQSLPSVSSGYSYWLDYCQVIYLLSYSYCFNTPWLLLCCFQCKFINSTVHPLAGVERSRPVSSRRILMFGATYSLSVTPPSPSDLLFSSLKLPLHLHISIGVMVRLLCVIRAENNINNNNKKTIVAFGPGRRGGKKRSLIMCIKERCWSRLGFSTVRMPRSSLIPLMWCERLGPMTQGEFLGSSGHFLKDEESKPCNQQSLVIG